jgi:hypothetical protein
MGISRRKSRRQSNIKLMQRFTGKGNNNDNNNDNDNDNSNKNRKNIRFLEHVRRGAMICVTVRYRVRTKYIVIRSILYDEVIV